MWSWFQPAIYNADEDCRCIYVDLAIYLNNRCTLAEQFMLELYRSKSLTGIIQKYNTSLSSLPT